MIITTEPLTHVVACRKTEKVLKATLVQKHCVSHSSNLHINRLQATTTLHVHFEYEAVNTYSLLMLRTEFPWTNEAMASVFYTLFLVLHSSQTPSGPY